MGLDLDLGYFIESYIEITSELIKDKDVFLKDYEKSLRRKLSEKFNISEQDILRLHHSFHWTFFNDKNGSPFEFSPDCKGGDFKVRAIREVTSKEKIKLKKYVLENYEESLLERLKEINN